MNPGALPPKIKNISTTKWKGLLRVTFYSWIAFITISLIIIYYPPPDSSNSITTTLCEGLKFLAYTMTGLVSGYPLGEAAASAES